jgi:hypothetical protein
MIISEHLGQISEAKIWLNELPDIKYEPVETLKSSFPAKPNEIWENKSICLEITSPVDHSRYGLLGLAFTLQQPKFTDVSILVSAGKYAPYKSSLLGNYEKGYVGIPRVYARVIHKTTNQILQHNPFPAGTLSFGTGAHGEYGSSEFMFVLLTRILMKTITMDLNHLVWEDIEKIIKDQFSMHKPLSP